MHFLRHFLRRLLPASLTLAPLASRAAEQADVVNVSVGQTGVSGLWVLANISYAGMRAQASGSTGWRIIAFIFGLPGTLVTFLAVKEGGERAYGIDVPKRR